MINTHYLFQERICKYIQAIPEIACCSFSVSILHITLFDINNLTFHINTSIEREFYEDDLNNYYKTFLMESNLKLTTIVELHQFLCTLRKEIKFRDLLHEYDGILYAYTAKQ